MFVDILLVLLLLVIFGALEIAFIFWLFGRL